ncbi:MAG TPA: ADP-ribosylglycohydrolase family protein [Chitinivibrionales bacterium]
MRSAIYAGIIGDALGVPVEATPRHELALCSVKSMLGYGRYDQPEGTWSDDSSLTLCTMESLIDGYNVEALGKNFCRWLFEGHWTSTGVVFDAGITTFLALDKIHSNGVSARESGCMHEDDNGNGALMRMLPVVLYFYREDTATLLTRIHEIASISHAHCRAKLGCGVYALMARELLLGIDKTEAYRRAVDLAIAHYTPLPEYKAEMPHFIRIFSNTIASLPQEHIRSSGYIIDTLEASIWCLLNQTSTKETLLAAVNLGLDTDTTGMVAGGLAGLCYGLNDIPDSWLDSLARKSAIDVCVKAFVAAALFRGAGVNS